MYKIKLIGELSPELTILGCKVDDIVHATFQKTNQAMFFDVSYCGHVQHCVVYPDNYEIIHDPEQKKVTVPAAEYFIEVQQFANREGLEPKIREFCDKHNHTVISNLNDVILDLRLFCDTNKLVLEDFSDKLTWFVDACFIVSATLVKRR
ncbi:MAG: hypothetical protein RBT49_15605 [Bacteroidales bacterium]|jgi:hypothetical protein|nr:hypothetical protein [Bacteroidales bacterium]